MIDRIRRLLLPALLLCCLIPNVRAEATLAPEHRLQAIIEKVGRGDTIGALDATARLLDAEPNFRLAHLIKGDLLTSRTRPIEKLGDTDGPEFVLDELRDEARARMRAETLRQRAASALPAALLHLGNTRHVILVDTAEARLFVFENRDGQPHYVTDFYVSQGKAGTPKRREFDNKTPLGVYRVTSFIPPSKLPDFYGSGAYPIDYPNSWDQRRGFTGNGIWLHGSPGNTYARAPLASEGCVVLSNDDLIRLGQYVTPEQTMVVIGDRLEWLDNDRWRAEREHFSELIESWRADWQSLDVDAYLRHYAASFDPGDRSRADWEARKRRLAQTRDWIEVGIDNLSVYRLPDDPDVVVVRFDQHYRSADFSNRMTKEQYWVRENDQWRIALEGDG